MCEQTKKKNWPIRIGGHYLGVFLEIVFKRDKRNETKNSNKENI